MPTPIDIRKFFNTDLPTALAANTATAKAVGARFQIGVTGAAGGDWTIDLTAKGPFCKAGKNGTADCTIAISDVDFRKLAEKPEVNALTLFMSGKLKITGNQGHALKLGKILSLVPVPT